jgi:hypothetical protein
MDRRLLAYIVLAFAVPLVSTAILVLTGHDIVDSLAVVIAVWICYPILCMGAYMWMTGTGERWLNNVNLSKYPEDQRRAVVAEFGVGITVMSVLLMIGISLVTMGTNGVIFCFIFIAAGIIAVIVPMVRTFSRKSFKPYASPSVAKEVAIVAGVTILALAPTFYFGSNFTGSVDLEFGEDSFSVEAPMFSHTFSYSEVEGLQYIWDFDKGTRVMGYATGTICSGRYSTDYFSEGDYLKYDLASYAKVAPCIVFWYDGDMYAFNQEDDKSTMQAYIMLHGRV